ncbi:MAG: hypothetical protein AAGA66_07370 [Bacteroidota bacterium]
MRYIKKRSFLLLITLYTYGLWGQTSGPTAPEYTSFESANVSNMVQLATGDFVYNLPLLEVPGPNGGYAVNLAYHANLLPGQEASWTGLGWNINVGAITRTVNGLPDDYYDIERTVNKGLSDQLPDELFKGAGYPGAYFRLPVSYNQEVGTGSSAFIASHASGSSRNLKYNHLRYYADEQDKVKLIGALHADKLASFPPFSTFFDSYALPEADANLFDQEAEKQRGGSLPAYDQYAVNAQGLNGVIQPHIFQNPALFRQDAPFRVRYFNTNTSAMDKVQFRFANEFSNHLSYSTGLSMAARSNGFDLKEITPIVSPTGYQGQHLEGARHIEWYTNDEIVDQNAFGLMDYPDFFRPADYKDQIGAFRVTNEAGITYHFSLPVYAFDETFYLESTKYDGVFLRREDSQPYAYQWLLTAVTGPDFVDKGGENGGPNGIVDRTDEGYWVRFDYTLWINDHQWRNPAIGVHEDLDNETEMFSSGKKQVYYLDAIVTQTHALVFEKSSRVDSREVMDLENGGFEPDKIYEVVGYDDDCGDDCEQSCDSQCGGYPGGCDGPEYDACDDACQRRCEIREVVGYENVPRPLLRLDQIKLVQAEDLLTGNTGDERTLSSIRFDYDYSLVPGTPNSYLENDPDQKKGKLTLQAVSMDGRRGAQVIPATTFTYSTNNPAFNRDAYDVWGYYKSDFDDGQHESAKRLTTSQSASNLDAWTLQRIENALGAVIEVAYESDTYSKSVLHENSLVMEELKVLNETELEVTLAASELDVGTLLAVGSQVTPVILYRITFNEDPCDQELPGSSGNSFEVLDDLPAIVRTIDGSTLVMESRELVEALTFEREEPVDCSANPNGYDFFEQAHPIGGNLLVTNSNLNYGGGLRVKSLHIQNGFNATRRSVAYAYDFNGVSSGVTPYEPAFVPPFETYGYQEDSRPIDLLKQALNEKVSNLLGIARELPAPGVVYSKVKVSESVQHGNDPKVSVPGYTLHEFTPFSADMVQRIEQTETAAGSEVTCNIPSCDAVETLCAMDAGLSWCGLTCSDLRSQCGAGINTYAYSTNESTIRPTRIQDFSSRMGMPKKVSRYGSDDQLLSEVSYTYLHDLSEDYKDLLLSNYSGQGIVSEAFHETRNTLKVQDNQLVVDEKIRVITQRESYPVILYRQTIKDIKSGIQTEEINRAFDFYSGSPTQTLATDSYGNYWLTDHTPAYRTYSGMGLMMNGGRHQLFPTTSTVMVKVSSEDKLTPTGLGAASVQTWSNALSQQNIGWYPQATYRWEGKQPLLTDGTYPIDDFQASPFHPTAPDASTNWKKTGEVTRYNQWGVPLESTDIDGLPAATLTSPDGRFIMAQASPAAYAEIAYSGSEYLNASIETEGNVSPEDGAVTDVRSHSGAKSLVVPRDGRGFTFTLRASETDLSQPYRASVWMYFPGYSEVQREMELVTLEAQAGTAILASTHARLGENKSKAWYLLTLDVTPADSDTDLTITCVNNGYSSVYMDDFRVHPLHAAMESHVYDLFTEEHTYTLDEDNRYIRYQYDEVGRHIGTFEEFFFPADRSLVRKQYNYKKTR